MADLTYWLKKAVGALTPEEEQAKRQADALAAQPQPVPDVRGAIVQPAAYVPGNTQAAEGVGARLGSRQEEYQQLLRQMQVRPGTQ